MKVYWQRLWALTIKEFLQLWRDRLLVLFIVYAFTLDVYVAGAGISLDLRRGLLVSRDLDQSEASRELLSRFREPEFAYEGDTKEPQQLLDQGKALVSLEIPPHFGRDLRARNEVEILVQIDTSNSVLGLLASSYATQIAAGFVRDQAAPLQAGTELPRIVQERRVWFNPNQNGRWFMGLSQLFNIVTLMALLLPATAMAREKERGTIEQLLVSPLTTTQILLPKVLAMTGVILTGTLLNLQLVLRGLFHLPERGNLGLFLLLTLLYVATTSGLGLLVATYTRNLSQVGMLTIFLFIPILLLSGAWTPPEAMPAWMNGLMLLSPLHYYLDAGLGILLKGCDLPLLLDSFAGLGLEGLVVFGLVGWRFRNQFS